MSNCNTYASGDCNPSVTTQPTAITTVPSRTVTGSDLPFTGGDIFGLSAIGVGAIIVGCSLLKKRPYGNA